MKKLLLLPLSLFFLLVVYVSLPHAESGWVLWKKAEVIKKELKQNIYWEIVNAYPNYNNCSDAKKRIWQTLKQEAIEEKKDKYRNISEVKEVPYELIIKSFKDDSSFMSWSENLYCLPGTLDPREK